jgi:hypothetical protein
MRRGFLNQEKATGDESIMMSPLQEPRSSQANQYSGWGMAANERQLKSMANRSSSSSSSAVGLQWPAPKVPDGAVEFDGPDWNAPNDKRRRMNGEEPRLANETAELRGTNYLPRSQATPSLTWKMTTK